MIYDLSDLPPPGLLPDLIDSRDHLHPIDKRWYGANRFPEEWSMYRYAPMPPDQGATSSCAAFAAMSFVYTLTNRMMGYRNALRINPWELYAQVRLRMGTFPADTGTNLRTLMSVMKDVGCVPYTHPHPRVNSIPQPFHGQRFRIPDFQRLGISRERIIEDLKYTLYVEGLPVMIGMAMPMDQMAGTTRISGTLQWTGNALQSTPIFWHGMALVGWDKTRFMAINSYGRGYGLHGYIWIEYEYLLDHAWTPDLWTVMNNHA